MEILIKTLDDIIEKVPSEDLDYFLVDLKCFIQVNQMAKNIDTRIKNNGLRWINDSEHNVTVTLKAE